jgi:hypothetical protein
MLKSREELEQNLSEALLKIKRNKKTVEDIKRHLNSVHSILPGFIQGIINDPETELPEIEDTRILCLITQQAFSKLEEEYIRPNLFFTENEIKKSLQYTAKLQFEDEIEFPLVLHNVTMYDADVYHFPLPIELLAKLSRSRKLSYNFDIQRESVIRKHRGEIIREAKLIMSNVVEIKDNIKNKKQEITDLVINAAVRTSDEGDELIYDPVERTLTITSGTRLDIVDGYHRSKASELAVSEMHDVKFIWGCWITNFTDDRAANYQGQLAKSTPIAKERQEYLSSSRNSDLVIKELRSNSELKDRISDTNRVRTIAKEVVSYRVLKDAIEEQFSLKTKKDVYDLSDYLKEFFDYFLGNFEDDFINNPEESRKKSIINTNNLFYGYICLARRMYENNIKARKVGKILSDIDFSKSNPMWSKELGILDEEGNFVDTKKARSNIKKFFEQIKLDE